MMQTIPFIDLASGQARIRQSIDKAIARVLDHGQYIMGPEIKQLESALESYCGCNHAISCSSGTDALLLVLMACGISHGDIVLVPSFTFAATAEAVAMLGARPIFVDVDNDTFNISLTHLEAVLETLCDRGLTAKAIIAVDMFGYPAEYDALQAIASRYQLNVVSDAAQSFGAQYKGLRTGNIVNYTTTSFFPAKPLGCFGDGGCVFTNDDGFADKVKSLRIHGKGVHKYENVSIGMNARMDTIQAAILLEKLTIFDDELERRQNIANYYNQALSNIVDTPNIARDAKSAWAQYTIVLESSQVRERLMQALKNNHIPTVIYYPKPLHQQQAYQAYQLTDIVLSNTEDLSRRVLSLPMHPYLDESTQERLVLKIQSILG